MDLLRAQFRGQPVAKFVEEGADLVHFLLPISGIHAQEFFHVFR